MIKKETALAMQNQSKQLTDLTIKLFGIKQLNKLMSNVNGTSFTKQILKCFLVDYRDTGKAK